MCSPTTDFSNQNSLGVLETAPCQVKQSPFELKGWLLWHGYDCIFIVLMHIHLVSKLLQ